jgi:cell wall-associated NlpC family hydrolase
VARYIKNFLFFLIFIIVMSGCTSKYVDNSDLSKNEYIFQSASLQNTIMQRDLRLKKYKELTKSKKNFDSLKNDLAFQDDRMGLNLELFDFYNEWEGVGYKFGGNSKDGIDCSAFIQKAFSEKFDLSMPRTTDMQSELGKEIDKSELKSGDLVFFRTGDTNHVGIYLEDGMFIHASTSNGVTISELDNVYFKENYWTARRIIN